MAFEQLLGSTILKKEGENIVEANTQETLESADLVGLYFSAHWCPPCKMFTPMLANYYAMMESQGKRFEVVFVSSDRSESQFNEYYGEMPWCSIPFSNSSARAMLGASFNVQGIPSLILLGPDGSVYSQDGREVVMSDPEGAGFPYAPRLLSEVLGNEFVYNSGSAAPEDLLEGKYVFLYFSAHWCGPCQAFTPRLIEWYNTLKASRDDFEVVFCSSDRSNNEFNEYFDTMPWVSLPFGSDKKAELSRMLGVQGIPTLVIVGPDGEVVNKDGRMAVSSDPSGSRFPYLPPPCVDISEGIESYGYDINSKPAMVLFLEGCDDADTEEMEEAVRGLAEEYSTAHKSDAGGPPIIFFKVTTDHPVGTRIRSLVGVGSASEAEDAQVVILDIPRGQYFRFPGEDVDEDALRGFVEGFIAGALEPTALG
jgi:nucleoredoxin